MLSCAPRHSRDAVPVGQAGWRNLQRSQRDVMLRKHCRVSLVLVRGATVSSPVRPSLVAVPRRFGYSDHHCHSQTPVRDTKGAQCGEWAQQEGISGTRRKVSRAEMNFGGVKIRPGLVGAWLVPSCAWLARIRGPGSHEIGAPAKALLFLPHTASNFVRYC